MTSASPPASRGLGLRTLLLLMFVAAALYAGALPVLVFARVGRALAALAQGTEDVVGVVVDLRQRGVAAEAAMRLIRAAVAAPARGPLDSIRALTARAATSGADASRAMGAELRTQVSAGDAALSDVARRVAGI